MMPSDSSNASTADRADDSEDRRPTTFMDDVVAGLASSPKTTPSKYLYDERGSQLFDQICELDAYYPTRTELGMMEAHADQMARAVGSGVRLVELGAGSGQKTQLLLAALDRPAVYVPIEISQSALDQCARRLRAAFPRLDVSPICADYTRRIELPEPAGQPAATAAYFPGSTLGNFHPDQAAAFLGRIAELVGDGGGLLIGVDLQKDPAILERAYNDEGGVTAAFNKNLLTRINRELDADFNPANFEHRAVWNDAQHRIEMHLVSHGRQQVHVGGQTFAFADAEFITTEFSYKYTPHSFEYLANSAGFEARQMWTDPRQWFSLWYLEANAG